MSSDDRSSAVQGGVPLRAYETERAAREVIGRYFTSNTRAGRTQAIKMVAIRKEEGLASVTHSVAEVDQWEHAHDDEEAARATVKAAKRDYEAALREKFFGF